MICGVGISTSGSRSRTRSTGSRRGSRHLGCCVSVYSVFISYLCVLVDLTCCCSLDPCQDLVFLACPATLGQP